MSIPFSQFIPPAFPPGNHKFFFSTSVTISVL